MSDYVFLFDLDATITKLEILPEIAAKIGMADSMREITEQTMRGEIPFDMSFAERVKILKTIPVSEVRAIIEKIPLNEEIVSFIKDNKERCYVVTGNLDVWIETLMERLGLEGHYFCSKASVTNDYIDKIDNIIDKGHVISEFSRPFVAVGDGNNDADMINAADIGIGFGGVREIAPAVLNCATHATYSEVKLCQFLRQLL